MARLIPTPPTGDIAWAASPMHNKPGRYDFRNARTEVFDSSRLHLFRRSFGNCKPAMPIVSAVDRHQSLTAIGVEEQLRVIRTLGQPYLQGIHASTIVLDCKASALS